METGPPAVTSAAAEIHRLLAERGETVATAESLTGGLLGAALTATAGASATYRGGLIVYATDLKATLADVSRSLLGERGAVDPAVAAELATGARGRLSATWGIGVTGVAGPDPQDGQPVGTVHVAVAGAALPEPRIASLRLSGDRSEIRRAAVEASLALLRDILATPRVP